MSSIVKDVMSTHVIAVRGNATYKEMAARLHEMHVSAFPVIDADDRVIGVVSESDLLTKAALRDRIPEVFGGIMRAREQAKAAGVTAAELMTAPAATVGPDDTVTRAARVMYGQRVKRLPVIDGDGRLIGIVSRADVLSVYGKPDEDIRRDILDKVISGDLALDPARYTVTVSDGIVTLEGAPETAAAAQDLADAIRHADGVVALRDRLTSPAGA